MDIKRNVETVLAKDSASLGLGIKVQQASDEQVTLNLLVLEKMTNGYNICHGGVIFSLADTALAFACVALGEIAVTQSAQIDYISSAKLGDQLRATTRIVNRRNRNILCDVQVVNQRDELIALVRGKQVIMRPKS
jgi:acyl-CoA thioesterase